MSDPFDPFDAVNRIARELEDNAFSRLMEEATKVPAFVQLAQDAMAKAEETSRIYLDQMAQLEAQVERQRAVFRQAERQMDALKSVQRQYDAIASVTRNYGYRW